MNIQRNIILCDCNLDTEFLESLEQNSELKWQVLICDNRKNNIKRILSHFIFPLKIFLFQK
ncbi:MAG: hypothetical protein FWH22_09015, partial [Fibromonadales bacterium]|nr:hypothetical protein [Fibromonadales bacterium]